MQVRKLKNPSGKLSIQIIDKSSGKYSLQKTIGSSDPLGYDIFPENKYEGHTMFPVLNGFKTKYK